MTAVLSVLNAFSQQATDFGSKTLTVDSAMQKDLIDVVQKILDKKTSLEKRKLPQKANFSIIPYAGYTLSTGLVVAISGNVGFYTGLSHNENYSIISAVLSYDTKNQKVFFTRSEIWTNENYYKVVSDLRFEKYPTETYGLGTFTTFVTDNHLVYNYLRIYETVLKKITGDLYVGFGYNLDYHYNITTTGNVDNSISDFKKYGQTARSSSSGINIDFLFDNRKNPFSPIGGFYTNITFRENSTFFKSDANWQSLQFDFRKYFRLSPNSNNILAIWSLIQFTSGNVPYLDLPTTGGDMYNNSGRGYAIGRFRGRDELYLEGEYRFRITRNGLLGGVVFANGESFSELQSNVFKRIAPAAGTGIRIKLNKHSDSNICIDYGVGTGDSHGFFVSLGEVF
ncbi:MAG: Surface antigen [Mucilaginibacter sp.]|nr:Surface antigen [Mucilaginibacter sp.]